LFISSWKGRQRTDAIVAQRRLTHRAIRIDGRQPDRTDGRPGSPRQPDASTSSAVARAVSPSPIASGGPDRGAPIAGREPLSAAARERRVQWTRRGRSAALATGQPRPQDTLSREVAPGSGGGCEARRLCLRGSTTTRALLPRPAPPRWRAGAPLRTAARAGALPSARSSQGLKAAGRARTPHGAQAPAA
jgi:hypothetical protein